MDATNPPLAVVMGVSGTGKTTIGEALAARLGLDYRDADSFHPQANIDKMAAGHPLDDDDRAPWLAAIGRWLAEHDSTGGVVSCSALHRAYRDVLRAAAPRVRFLHLAGDPDVIATRMRERPEHFFKVEMLASQLATLEPLEDDEPGVTADLSDPVDQIVDQFLAALTPSGGPS
ncbi:gluconokinase [Angustibacter sp. McL0619]|uniref:gluconokinase n=1 Tax=Angustibacter sp. McL0619 TaxID=3415676 RepID=UPI003CEF6561